MPAEFWAAAGVIGAATITGFFTLLGQLRGVKKEVKSPNGMPTGETVEAIHQDIRELRGFVLNHVTDKELHR